MFPSELSAQKVMQDLRTGGYADEDVLLVRAEAILEQVNQTIGPKDGEMPSVGTERSFVRQHEALAKQGHVALMAFAPSEEETERVMTVARRQSLSSAQRYLRFAIQDLL